MSEWARLSARWMSAACHRSLYSYQTRTALALAEAGIAHLQVEDVTGFPEMLDGRVKTMHPRLMAGVAQLRVPLLAEVTGQWAPSSAVCSAGLDEECQP